jgi:hypothetical protein
VSVIIRLRALAKDAALAAFASAKPGRPASAEAVEVELLRAEKRSARRGAQGDGGRAHTAPGKATLGLFGPVPARVSAEIKLELLGLIDQAVAGGWAHTRACGVLDLADSRAYHWRVAAENGASRSSSPWARGACTSAPTTSAARPATATMRNDPP